MEKNQENDYSSSEQNWKVFGRQHWENQAS